MELGAGENIGTGGPVADATDPIARMALGLTQSMIDEKPPNDGHRRNILSTSFTRIGIVVTRDSHGSVWLTQDFMRRLTRAPSDRRRPVNLANSASRDPTTRRSGDSDPVTRRPSDAETRRPEPDRPSPACRPL